MLMLATKPRSIDPHQAELYLSALTHAHVSNRSLSLVEERLVERMRERHPEECARMDRTLNRNFKKARSSRW